jgi:predicted nucleic acid-binding protein
MPDRLRIYLDNCCYGRPFDNQEQVMIYRETEAIKWIQDGIKEGRFNLCWSAILDLEIEENPNVLEREGIGDWKSWAFVDIEINTSIIALAGEYEKVGLKQKDALHVASAVKASADYFISTDLRLLRKPISEIRILNPIDFVRLIKEIEQ